MARKILNGFDMLEHASALAAPGSGYRRLFMNSEGFLCSEDSAGVITYLNNLSKRLTADASNSTTTPQSVSDLSFSLKNGGHYYARWSGIYTTAVNTTGIRYGITGPTAGTDGVLTWQKLNDTATTMAAGGTSTTAGDTHNGASGTGPGSVFLPWELECEYHAGADGTLNLRIWSELASQVTFKKNSIGQLWRID